VSIIPCPTGLQLDLLTALQRIMQVDREETPEGFMWHRVVTCDVPRLTKYLAPETIAWHQQEFPDDDGDWRPHAAD
jgi:hypothetical protein